MSLKDNTMIIELKRERESYHKNQSVLVVVICNMADNQLQMVSFV